MGILLGIGAALTYGAGDFVGGFVTKRANVFHVVFWSQSIGCILLIPALFIVGWARDRRHGHVGGSALGSQEAWECSVSTLAWRAGG